MRYYRSATGGCRGGSGSGPRSRTEPVDLPHLSSRSAAVSPPRRHENKTDRPASHCTAGAMRGAVPQSTYRLQVRCCSLLVGSSAMKDHDDNPFHPWSVRVEGRHDLQGHGCPDVVPCVPRFGLR